jgi:hypothetical protein
MHTTMARGTSSFFKSVVAPLGIAILLYALLFHALLPLYRRHRERYSGYTTLLPSSFTSRVAQYTPSFISKPFEWISDRLSNSLIIQLFRPGNWHTRNSASADHSFNWRYNPEAARHGVNPFIPRAADEDDTFDEEEGEGMVGFDVRGRQDAGALPRMVDRERYAVTPVESATEDSGRRLSRELEEGFRDDSDDDEDEDDGRRRTLARM